MLIFNLQNIKDRECFMNRLMIECMDDKAMELCKGSGYIKQVQKLCAHLTTNALRAESKTDYNDMDQGEHSHSCTPTPSSRLIATSFSMFQIWRRFTVSYSSSSPQLKTKKLKKLHHSHQDFNAGQLSGNQAKT